MARDQESVSEAEFDELRQKLADQREELYEDLAEDLGGDPDDYRVRPRPDDSSISDEAVTDGGE